MIDLNNSAKICVDASNRYQKIEGFGVNINSNYWDNGKLIPVVDLLIYDLGATLFRVDAYGRSNWIDPFDQYDASILNKQTYEQVYNGVEFKNGYALCKYLNTKGIKPYISMSGIVPKWMCSEDGKTLYKYREFAEMAASYAYWMKYKAKVDYSLFGPLNETDLGPPEGPLVSADEYAKVCQSVIEAFDRWGLEDIKLVVTEQSQFSLDFVMSIINSKKLQERIGVFGMHCYSDDSSRDLVKLIYESSYSNCSIWMTEYGDLDCTGEKEWHIACVLFNRLMQLLEDGMHAALNWNAFDDYHSHDEAWNIYGLLRSARKIYTPKKRYYTTKQAYRFIPPETALYINMENVSIMMNKA